MSDIGMDTTIEIINRLKDKIRKEKINDPNEVYPALKEVIKDMLLEGTEENTTEEAGKKVLLVIGVNGVGKTTSIGKLAAKNKNAGKKVILAAADTFRAAAIDQLEVWSERAGVDLIKHSEGSDPAAVVFDAVNAAKARNIDLLICDTAGRLHNKKNLMDELSKIGRIIDREFTGAAKETLLVLDATTGQNAVIQAKQFMEACPIDGIILTKLDGTAKGGVVISIKNSLNIPVRYIGVGEGIDDLQEFDAESFAEALF
ncbi:MAG: signal recognition particle-docking protein FtsY, partial [Clostridium sp.]|uniref:signal recognition particle-docking protein FtsY n=1 Tax=Clostridium sp. TaxID=1506 RepID=UPI0025BBB06A